MDQDRDKEQSEIPEGGDAGKASMAALSLDMFWDFFIYMIYLILGAGTSSNHGGASPYLNLFFTCFFRLWLQVFDIYQSRFLEIISVSRFSSQVRKNSTSKTLPRLHRPISTSQITWLPCAWRNPRSQWTHTVNVYCLRPPALQRWTTSRKKLKVRPFPRSLRQKPRLQQRRRLLRCPRWKMFRKPPNPHTPVRRKRLWLGFLPDFKTTTNKTLSYIIYIYFSMGHEYFQFDQELS